jgi:hypothetical protein
MLLSELEFGSFLAYSVRGTDEGSIESQSWMRRLKNERYVGKPPTPMSRYVAHRLRVRFDETGLSAILSPSAVLVPVPSSRISKPATLWVPLLIAHALVSEGLARACEPCLHRAHSLNKAAIADTKDRPTAIQHFESLSAARLLFPVNEFVLVDDVVTRGATLIGAASRLREASPDARIKAFAVMRAISTPTEFRGILDPCVGTIQLARDGMTVRRP